MTPIAGEQPGTSVTEKPANMGNTRLRPDGVVPFVDASQEDVAEVNGPDAVVDLLEADGVLLERVGDEQQPPFQADGSSVGDASLSVRIARDSPRSDRTTCSRSSD